MSEYLRKFFAVTCNSVYRVTCGKGERPFIEKIGGVKGKSGLPIGTKFNDGKMLAVAKHLQFYEPEAHSMLSPQTSEERRLEHVNTAWWGTGTSSVIALFFDEKEALSCSEQSDLRLCDQRWIEKTKEVIEEIGNDHPNVTICHWQELSLLPVNSAKAER